MDICTQNCRIGWNLSSPEIFALIFMFGDGLVHPSSALSKLTLCCMGNLATLSHLVYCWTSSPLFQTLLTFLVRYTVLLFMYLVFINFGGKLFMH